MKIHLVPLHQKWLDAMQKVYRWSEPKLHELIDDPEAADIILFLGMPRDYGKGIVDNPLPKRYPEKSFTYWDSDGVIPLLPGIYTNAEIPRLFDLHRTESHMFIEIFNEELVPQPNAEKKYLCAFLGGSTSLLRKKMFKMDFGRPDVLIRNTSAYKHWDLAQPGRKTQQKDYADSIAACHFGLCPRGASAGALRIFEVMQMGIAPVLISDRFKLPEGPDWDKFLIRLPESKLKQMPEILDGYLPQAAERGRLARLAWEQYFAPPVVFNSMMVAIERVRSRRRMPERYIHRTWWYMLFRYHFHRSARQMARQAVLGILRKLGMKFAYDLSPHQ